MKQLIILIGPNGVGKSTTARTIVEQCENTAYVDSDWCRVMNPFTFTKTTKHTISENIYCLLHNYLACKDINAVVFTYGWHGARKEIYENMMKKSSGSESKQFNKSKLLRKQCKFVKETNYENADIKWLSKNQWGYFQSY